MTFTQNQIGRSPSYGIIYLNGTTGASFSFTTSYTEITGLSISFALSSASQDFAMTTDGRLKYTGIPDKLFAVSANLFTVSSTSPEWLSIQIYKNGSAVSESSIYSGTSVRVPGFSVTMSTNDYLSIFTKAQAAASNIIYTAKLSATSINRV